MNQMLIPRTLQVGNGQHIGHDKMCAITLIWLKKCKDVFKATRLYANVINRYMLDITFLSDL